MEQKTVVLGAEWDRALFAKLRGALRAMGAVEVSGKWGVGGSQQVTLLEYRVGRERIRVEAETYMGLRLSGPTTLVDRIVADMQS